MLTRSRLTSMVLMAPEWCSPYAQGRGRKKVPHPGFNMSIGLKIFAINFGEKKIAHDCKCQHSFQKTLLDRHEPRTTTDTTLSGFPIRVTELVYLIEETLQIYSDLREGKAAWRFGRCLPYRGPVREGPAVSSAPPPGDCALCRVVRASKKCA